MRIKHLLTLKQVKNQPPMIFVNYNKEFNHFKRNNITKTNKIPPFNYRDLVYYIKTQNPSIPNLQILQCIRGKKWKDKIKNLDFNKIWINTYF